MDALLSRQESSVARAGHTQNDFWGAFLALEIEERGGKSVVSHVQHEGPLRIQRPFYPDASGALQIYLLHPPGGVAGGDQLRLELEAGARTSCLVTAPAANKIYRSRGPVSEVSQELTVREGALVEWLPQETIAFSGARCRLGTYVRLEQHARFIGWEITCLGRPAAQEEFLAGRLDQRFEIWRGGVPLFLDRLVVGESSDAMESAWGLFGNCVVGTLLITADGEEIVEEIRSILLTEGRWVEHAACTQVGEVVTLRYVGPSARDSWMLFRKVWQRVRPRVAGDEASLPRIWNY